VLSNEAALQSNIDRVHAEVPQISHRFSGQMGQQRQNKNNLPPSLLANRLSKNY